MKNRKKAALLTALFVLMFLAILYFITFSNPSAWKVYGILFGILGVDKFTTLLFRWIVYEPRATRKG